MKESEINIKVILDDEKVPERIVWDADDKGGQGPEEAKAVSVALWDHKHLNTLRIDLWTKEMPVDEMKQFYIDSIGGLGQSLLNATGDDFMSNEIKQLCERLLKHVQEENERGS